MKVSLIQPRYFNIWEAIGHGYIGGYIKREFKGKLEIDFFQGHFDDDRTIVQGARDSDVVGFSCTSPTFRHAVSLARQLKKLNPRIRTVFGGFHPSAVPEDCLEEEAVDQVVVGEGEHAFLRILNGEEAPLIDGEAFAALNEVMPDRHLIKNGRTVDLCEKMAGIRATSFQSVRVCPFRCAFCAERIVTGVYNRATNPLRLREAGHLLDEIEEATRDYSLNYLKFADATWNTSREQTGKVFEFCEEKLRRNFRVPWEANVHATYATREMIFIMKKAGCDRITSRTKS